MAFYEEVFGWTFEPFGDDGYWICKTGRETEPGISGGIMKRVHPDQPVVNTVLVDNIDDYTRKIVAFGGEIVVPKMANGPSGFLCYCKDLDGHMFGVAEMANESTPPA